MKAVIGIALSLAILGRAASSRAPQPASPPPPAPTDPVERGIELYNNQQDKVDLAILHLERFLQLAPDAPEAPQVKGAS